ncbi:MAG: preprotein translocase subunit YajC [Planctomycetes bacterium]|nr:preprotein translocase subunit YajC [Planctomycetota bacterium]
MFTITPIQEGAALPSASTVPLPSSGETTSSTGTPLSDGVAAPAPSGGIGGLLLPMGILFGFMWLFVIRPEKKRQKERTSMLGALEKGHKVVTMGGLHGEIVNLSETTVTLKVGDGIRLKFDRHAVSRGASEEADPHEASSPAMGTS